MYKLEKVEGTSKKTGKPFTGYVVKIGEYSTPMFFPSKVELIYIKEQIAKEERKEFQKGWLTGEEEDADTR